MSEPFVAQLRARARAIELAPPGTSTITVRVEMPEVWDTVKVSATPEASVSAVKDAALQVLYPLGAASEFVIKLRGWEVLDESESLSGAGAVDGSIFLLTHRRRRAVR